MRHAPAIELKGKSHLDVHFNLNLQIIRFRQQVENCNVLKFSSECRHGFGRNSQHTNARTIVQSFNFHGRMSIYCEQTANRNLK